MPKSLDAVLAVAILLGSTAFAAAPSAPQNDITRGATRLTSAPSYVPLPPISSAVGAGVGIGGMITVELGFDIPDARLRSRVTAMRPRVMDAMRATVADYALTRIRPGAPPDPTVLSRLAQTAMDAAVGGPGARVLIANVMITERR